MISLPEDATRPPAKSGPRPGEPSGPPRIWTVGELLAWTERRFSSLGTGTPRLEAELLLAHAMGLTRLELYTGFGKIVEARERAAFRELVVRRCRHEPVAYLIGYREFYSLRLEVTPGVLIPRPETEFLVEWALEEIERLAGEPVRVLDLGTGSGNIAVAIAANSPQVRVTAVDISPGALEVAQRNVDRHGLSGRISLLQGDLFDALEDDMRFDLIVSNPPYVARHDYDELMPDVRNFEPSLALLDTRSGDGLGFYRCMLDRAAARALPRFVVPGGSAALELGASQAGAVRELFRQVGWHDIEVRRDYAGIERVVTARDPRSRSADGEPAAR